MKKRLFFIIFMTLFCSTMFGQDFTPKYAYQNNGAYPEPMSLLAKISFDGVVQNNPNLELGVFCDEELRGGCFLSDVFGTGENVAMISVYGKNGQKFTFKVYDHTPGVESEKEWTISSRFISGSGESEHMSYNADGYVDPINPAVINFVTPNHWTPNTFDSQFNFNVIAVVMKDGVEQTDTNLELGVFDADGKVRGSVKLISQTILGNTRYYADMLVPGSTGEEITFRLYDHGIGQEFSFNEVNSCVLTEEKDESGNPKIGSYIKPFEVNFITAPYVAQIGENKYTSLAKAVEAAAAGNTIEVIADISDETVTVDKNLTITKAENVDVTLNNVAINAEGADELTVSNLLFTGNSWINSGTAEKLTVSGVNANVTPSNTAQTNSRSAFISLGSSEQQTLELAVTNCNIVANGGGDAILGWATITKANLTGNTFGSSEAYQTNSDCVKFMAIANGAEFNITGNTIYSNYNGIVFGQNTTRDNAYTVNVSGNNFYGSADHIWLEVSGATTCHATVKATSDNKVNGNAFTAKDINVHPNITTWTSYGGVDVVFDGEGKVLGGSFKYIADAVIADGYESSQNTDGTYSIVKKLSGEIAYRAYVTDTETVEALSVDLRNVYASNFLKVELYSESELLVTTTYAKADFPIDADLFTCFMVLSGTADEYWNTKINAEELTIENLPTTIKLYVDGEEESIYTFENALGAGTNVDETEKYKALDCVYDYKVAMVGDKFYWNIDKAIANWTAGSTLTLLADVTLSDVITLKSTEHHILNLGSYTMTAASGKNAIEIKSYGFENRSEREALTIKADETKPGTIDAGAKSCIYYKYDATLAGDKYDRPIIYIKGGVYEGSSYSGISSNGHNSAQDKCATFNISGGTFNCGLNLTKTKLLTSGGLFNYSVSCTGGSTSIRLISGGTFKSWVWMTADAASKFAVGTAISQYNVGVYVDDKGYLVVGGPVITEEGTTFKASSANYSGWSSYLQYSSAATNGLYYTSAEEALADNNKTTGSVNIYTDELDLTSLNYKGTLVIEDDLTVTFNEGTTPAWSVATEENGKIVVYTDYIENGIVKRTYRVIVPVAKIGDDKFFASLAEAIAAAQADETITMLADITLTETLTIEEAITLDLNNKTVTGAVDAIVFNVKAAIKIENGTVKGNKSGTSSGLIDIYANLDLNGVTIETSKINALRFKAGDCTATLTYCNVTGAFKGYGGSVWEIKSGTYKASSTSISDQLNGTASISGGTFHYEIAEEECAPGYVVNDNGDGTWTVVYAPAAFVDANNNGILDEGEAVYGNLDQIFAKHKEGNVYVVLTANIVANTQVDTDADAHYYITTNVEGGVTMNFLFEDDWNYIQKMTLGQNITLNAKHLLAWTEFNVGGTINTDYLYTTVAKTTINEGAVVNVTTGDATVQVKNGAQLTVNGTLNASILNVWVGESKLVVSGANAKVDVAYIDIWDGTPSVTVENGATLDVDYIKASRGGSIAVDGATLKSGNIELGHNGESTGELTVTNNGVIEGEINLTVVGSTVEGPEGLNVVSGVGGYMVIYENNTYKLVKIEGQSIVFGERWNWFSHYVVGDTDSDILNQLKNGLGEHGVQIKNQNQFIDYGTNQEGDSGWWGDLKSTSVKEMYKVNTSLENPNTITVVFEGAIVNPESYPITLNANWNYIGYPLTESVSVKAAFASVAKDGDYVKSQDAFAEYYNGNWHGNLKTMTPGEGYMYRNVLVEGVNDVTKTLIYSYPRTSEIAEANITAENNHWVPASSQYADNMTMIAMLDVKGEDYEVAAFVNGEVRGSARATYIESLDAYMFFMTIHGEGVEEMTFKCYDLATGEDYLLDNRMNYSSDAVVGTVREPYMLTCSTLGIGENAASVISIYPNPATTGNEINLAATCDTVEVFNALGVKIAEYQNVDTIDAIETAGVYMIRVTNNGNVQNCRLVVK